MLQTKTAPKQVVNCQWQTGEPSLFITGVLAHLALQFDLTPRVEELKSLLDQDQTFKSAVKTSIYDFQKSGALTDDAMKMLEDFLHL